MDDYIPVGHTGSAPLLLCPVCGSEMTRPVGIECLPPGTAKGRVVITADGLMVDPYTEPVGRGVRITLCFQCDQDHRFAYRFHFHKGRTIVRRLEWQTLPESEPMRTIWQG